MQPVATMFRRFFIVLCSVSLLACDVSSLKKEEKDEELIDPEEKKAVEEFGGLYPEV